MSSASEESEAGEFERCNASLTPLELRKVEGNDHLEVFLIGGEVYVAAGSKEEALGWALTEYYKFEDSETLEATSADDHDYYPDLEETGMEGPSYPMVDEAREQSKTKLVPFIVAYSTQYL